MKDLLEAFQIFSKYISEENNPTICEHDVMFVMCDPERVSKEDIKRLRELSFILSPDGESFRSFRFGSA